VEIVEGIERSPGTRWQDGTHLHAYRSFQDAIDFALLLQVSLGIQLVAHEMVKTDAQEDVSKVEDAQTRQHPTLASDIKPHNSIRNILVSDGESTTLRLTLFSNFTHSDHDSSEPSILPVWLFHQCRHWRPRVAFVQCKVPLCRHCLKDWWHSWNVRLDHVPAASMGADLEQLPGRRHRRSHHPRLSY